MNFFEYVPENFFGILAFSNKAIIIQAILSIYEALQVEWTISKEDLAVRLINDLDGVLDTYQIEEEDSEDIGTIASHVHSLIRRLKKHGWIDIETNSSSFEEMITIPDYAFQFMKVIYELTNGNTEAEYNRYVYSTYSVLKTSSDSQNEYYTAVNAAYSHTNDLTQKLRMLLNNIKKYHVQLSESQDMNRILYEHFDDFKATIADKIYYPIKTFDSVHRYKIPILRYLKDWLADETIIDQMVEEVWIIEAQKGNKSEKEVKVTTRHDAIKKMIDVMDIYNGIDELIAMIDRKNSEYTKATFDRIEFLLNTDRSVKGKLKEIIKAVNNAQDDRWTTRLQEAIMSDRQSNFNEASLYKPRLTKQRKDSIREKVREIGDLEVIAGAADEFKDFVRQTYSQQKIYEHVIEMLEGRERLHVSDIQIDDDQDYIRTVLSVLAGEDKKAGYRIDYQDGEVQKEHYRVPDFEFVKGKSI